MRRNVRQPALMAGLLGLTVLLAGCQLASSNSVAAGRTADVALAAAPLLTEATETVSTPTSSIVRPKDPAPAPTSGPEEVVQVASAGEAEWGFNDGGEPYMGDPDATVLIEEFSSYQCPFCGKYFRETYPELVAMYVETGQVLYVFRDFPLPSQPQSHLAAEAAGCAGSIGGAGAFWAMHDLLMERQSEWSGRGDAGEIFARYGGEIGLELADVASCLESGAMRERVEVDAAEGSKRGVRGTPTFFINGQPLVGAQPYAAFAQAIEIALAGGNPVAAPSPTPMVAPTPAAIAPASDAMVLGVPSAPVTVVEFSDYQCPFCQRYSKEAWPQMRAQLVDSGRIRYVFKDFPLTGIHPQAPKAHEAARCAGEQNAYWQMHDLIFAGQASWSASDDPGPVLRAYASELGLDSASFDTCLSSGRWANAVQADVEEGLGLGVRGTPTFFINGYPLVGAYPFETLEYVVTLAEQGVLGEALRNQQ